jgi:hypothetical protein
MTSCLPGCVAIAALWWRPLDNLTGSGTIGVVNKSRKGLGCLILFALPFAAAGLLVGFFAGKMLWFWIDVRDWQEVPARVVHTELITNTGDDSTTYDVRAKYLYEFRGATYEGERVGLSTGSDNIGSFHQDAHRELSHYQTSGETFRCYVNPRHPSDAVLYRDLRWGLFALMGVFATIFTGVGVGLIIAGIWGNRRLGDEGKRVTDNPAEPWRWKEDWADGRITATGRAQFLLPGIMAVFWNLISVPLLFLVPEEVRDNGNYLALLGLIFPLVGLGLAIWAIRSFIRWKKFGDSVFEMSTFPGVIGGPVAGRVLTSVNVKAAAGYRLTLSCINRVTRGSGKNRSTRESILWQQDSHLQRESAEFDSTRSEIPVDFQIPFDASPTEERSEDDETLWRLQVEAEVPGVDYSSQFDVPVFRTAESREAQALADPSDVWGAEEPPPIDLAQHGIDSELLSTGARRLTFRAARHKGPAFMLTGFLILWLGFNYLLIHLEAPIFFPILWGFFSVLIFLGALDLWFDRRIIEVHSDRLVLSGGIFGLGRTREIQRTEIREIKAIRGMQSGNKLFYRIQIITQDEKKHIAATKLDNLSLAKEVIGRLD